MSSSLPFTVQDDIEQKEKYAASKQQSTVGHYCNSRRIRTWSLIILVTLCTLGLVTYFGNISNSIDSLRGTDILSNNDKIVLPEDVVLNDIEEPVQTLKEEISNLISGNQLIVFSKTYCPYSMKAKRILSLYKFKFTVPVVEVNLRDDDYQVKLMLQELSGRDTFPNIFFNGKTLGGFDQLDELHATGQLDILFKDILIPK